MPQDGEKKLFVGDRDHWIECTFSAAAGGWIDCHPVPRAARRAISGGKASTTKPAKLERLTKAELVRLIQTVGLKNAE